MLMEILVSLEYIIHRIIIMRNNSYLVSIIRILFGLYSSLISLLAEKGKLETRIIFEISSIANSFTNQIFFPQDFPSCFFD